MPKTFDVDALVSELELDQEDIVELIQDFREFLEEAIPELEAAVEKGDHGDSRSKAHAIKGSSGNLRVTDVYQTSLKMQDAADASDGETLKTLMAELKIHVDAFFKEAAEL